MIPKDQLRRGAVYELRSRNLLAGVYSSEGRFIGIRLKFDNHYLDMEILNDPPGRGTAVAVSYLGEINPHIHLSDGWRYEGKWVRNTDLYEALEEYPHA